MKRAKRILVGLKTIDHTTDLTSLACRLGATAATLILVHVIELPDPTPLDVAVPDLDAAAKHILDKARRIAQRGRFKVKAKVLRAHSATSALLDEMKENNVDLAVLGYHHRRTIGEIIAGTTARHLASQAPCHILFSIPPRER